MYDRKLLHLEKVLLMIACLNESCSITLFECSSRAESYIRTVHLPFILAVVPLTGF